MKYKYNGIEKIRILGKVLENGEEITIKEGQEGLLNKNFVLISSNNLPKKYKPKGEQ